MVSLIMLTEQGKLRLEDKRGLLAMRNNDYYSQGHFDGFNGVAKNRDLLSCLENESDIQAYLKGYEIGLQKKMEVESKPKNKLKDRQLKLDNRMTKPTLWPFESSLDNNYYSRSGWLDAYYGNPNNPLRLGDLTPKEVEDYQRGWHKGKEDLRRDYND